MAFFSFSLLNDPLAYLSNQFEPNQKYFSKDTTLWKELNNRNKKKHICILNHEKRSRLNFLGNKLLICLPPKFGLGDAVEYCVAIKSIIENNTFSKIGIAFCSDMIFIFKDIFSFTDIYPLFISEKEMQKYDSVFHITLEIDALKFQKYKRSDIVVEICKYFKIPPVDFKVKENKFLKRKIKEITIFPVSTSLIRSMPYNILDQIIRNFQNKYRFKICIDDSDFSKYLIEKKFNNCVFIKPLDIKSLVSEIKKIEFGIFMDSGPLHIAKIFDKKGLFIETSVPSKTLLTNYKNINSITNKYKSNNCNGPCGLVDIFSFNNKVGCYENHKIDFNKIKELKNLKNLQRWNKKDINSHFFLKPVGCVSNINIKDILKMLDNKLKEF